ncbi:MAG: DNA adenine methylase [Bradyrhizobium sp.]|uniref:DNA adenine methylase n=1 Tax=Bradyrhizobium sp. TaxID=376 RepID=UPI003D0C6BD3
MPLDAHRSPFRYPGGKASLAPFLADVIRENFGVVERYCEPFAGGAGAATLLLGAGLIECAHLNDADPRVYYAWNSILEETEEFLERLNAVPLTMNEWWRQKDIIDNITAYSTMEIGFATFFLNRTNRSGILQKAGPIGGYAQEGKWGLEARFNRQGLRDRIQFIASNKNRIELTNLDAISLMQDPKRDWSSCLLFIDPPYVGAGSRLYFNSMDEEKHILFASILNDLRHYWLLTYDDHYLVRALYSTHVIDDLPIRYALQRKRVERELLIKSPDIRLPATVG